VDDVSLFHHDVGHFEARFVDPADDPSDAPAATAASSTTLAARASTPLGAGMRRDDATLY